MAVFREPAWPGGERVDIRFDRLDAEALLRALRDRRDTSSVAIASCLDELIEGADDRCTLDVTEREFHLLYRVIEDAHAARTAAYDTRVEDLAGAMGSLHRATPRIDSLGWS